MDNRSIAAFIETKRTKMNSVIICLPSKGAGQEKRTSTKSVSDFQYFCSFEFSTFIGNYIYSLVDVKNATDIRPLAIKPIIAGNFRRFFFNLLASKKQTRLS